MLDIEGPTLDIGARGAKDPDVLVPPTRTRRPAGHRPNHDPIIGWSGRAASPSPSPTTRESEAARSTGTAGPGAPGRAGPGRAGVTGP